MPVQSSFSERTACIFLFVCVCACMCLNAEAQSGFHESSSIILPHHSYGVSSLKIEFANMTNLSMQLALVVPYPHLLKLHRRQAITSTRHLYWFLNIQTPVLMLA